jgi:hypothetical protein
MIYRMQIKKERKEIIHFSLEVNNHSAVPLKIRPQNDRKPPTLHCFKLVSEELFWLKMQLHRFVDPATQPILHATTQHERFKETSLPTE